MLKPDFRLFFRYGNAEICHCAVEGLLPPFELMDPTTHRPEFLHLQWLLKRLVPLCDQDYLAKLAARFPPVEHLLIWKCLGVDGFFDGLDVVDDLICVVRDGLLCSEGNKLPDFQNLVNYLYHFHPLLYSVRGFERSELGGSHGCSGRLWDRLL